MKKFKCPFCNYENINVKPFNNHLTKLHKEIDLVTLERERFYEIYGKELVDITIDDYVKEKYCASNLPIPISKLLKLMNLKRTSKEERQTKRYKENCLFSLQAKYGKDIVNISQLKEVKDKKIQTYISNFGSLDNWKKQKSKELCEGYKKAFNTAESKLKMYEKARETIRLKYGVDNVSQIEYIKQKQKETRKKYLDTLTLEEKREMTKKCRATINHRGGYSSSLEKRVQHILVEMNVSFIKNVTKFNYNYDILIDKTFIEIQGDLWHAWPGKYKETDLIMGKILVKNIWDKDERKRNMAEKNGYKIHYIWEHELNKMSDEEIKMKILEFIEN